MSKNIIMVFLTGAAYMTWLSISMAGTVDMPMRFTSNSNPEQVLKSYPLGKLNKQMALSHHGKEDEQIILPNGLQAWVYNVDFYKMPKSYTLPSGKEKLMLERKKNGINKKYLLVFSNDNKIIDVIHIKNFKASSALKLQLDD